MKYEARRFDLNQYKKYDKLAKELLKDHLLEKEYKIISEEEDYMHDIVVMDGDRKIFFEVEVKIGYPFTSQEDFPFKTVSFAGRKIRLHKEQPFFYVIIDVETKTMVCCHSSIIFNEEYAETIYITKQSRRGLDMLYRVPKEICIFMKL